MIIQTSLRKGSEGFPIKPLRGLSRAHFVALPALPWAPMACMCCPLGPCYGLLDGIISHTSYRQYHGLYGHLEDGHGVLCGDHIQLPGCCISTLLI